MLLLLRRQLSQDTHAGQCAAKGFPSTWCSLAIQLDLGTILKLDAKLQGDLAAPWPRHPTAIDHFCRRTPYYSSHTILNLHFCSCLQAYSRAKTDLKSTISISCFKPVARVATFLYFHTFSPGRPPTYTIYKRPRKAKLHLRLHKESCTLLSSQTPRLKQVQGTAVANFFLHWRKRWHGSIGHCMRTHSC